MLSVLRSWNDPLLHLVSEVQRIQEAPDTILWKAMEIEEQNKRLLEGMEKIVGRVSRNVPFGLKANVSLIQRSIWPMMPRKNVSPATLPFGY